MTRGLLGFSLIPALLLIPAGIIIFIVEDDNPVRLLATIGGGLGISGFLIGLLAFVSWSNTKMETSSKRVRELHRMKVLAVILVFALAGTAVGGHFALRELDTYTNGVRVEARITGIEERGAGEQPSVFYLVEYEIPQTKESRKAELSPVPQDLWSRESLPLIASLTRDHAVIDHPAAVRSSIFAYGVVLTIGLLIVMACLVAIVRGRARLLANAKPGSSGPNQTDDY